MGSLMGGWDSHVLGDDTKARRMRNRSLTQEEVEAFRRQQQGKDGGDDVTSPPASPRPTMEKSPLGSWKQRTETSPFAPGHEDVDTVDAEAAGASPGSSRDWWTRSNSAFLNEAPHEDAPGTAHSYTPQFHVAAGRSATHNA